ncbi:MAG: pilus assembly protein [Fluviibacter sp.]
MIPLTLFSKTHSRLARCRLVILLAALLLPVTAISQSTFPAFGIIHNSLIKADQSIMLGVNPYGNLNTPDGSGTAATNTLNQAKDSRGNTLQYVNSGSVGISYYWPAGPQRRNYSTGALISGAYYIPGWYDSTSQGNKWEAWGAGAVDNRNQQAWASISAYVGQSKATALTTMTVKSFTVDATSVKSTVWINDTSGLPMLEVTHLYGPTAGATNKNLFQGLVTITNISGGTLTDVRYRRTMDWDVIENVMNPLVDAVGVRSSYNGTNFPKIWSYCDNGGEDNGAANPFAACKPYNGSTLNQDYTGLNGQNYSSAGTGSSFDFQFGDLYCNESATFYIYYGAGDSRTSLAAAMNTVGATTYSMGYDPNYPTLAYTFGFKGVSGTAVPPALPTKVASLPGGSSTDSNVYQTYAPPVLGDGTIYQALFRYQKDKQWIGEIKRYALDATGAIKKEAPILASTGLKARAAVNGDFSSGGRSIWTVGYDPRCMASPLSNDSQNNSFTIGNASLLEKLLFNCPATANAAATTDLINFSRGLNAYLEDAAPATAVRTSVLGDTYHSEMVMVGAPNAPWSSDFNKFGKSEAYYRYTKGYSTFIANNASRRSQIYVGANDGMLHAFDLNLNERWAFIPPPVVSMLRNMSGDKGSGTLGGGKSNSIFSVDGPITVKDVYFTGEAKWKTVLMGGLGWGGNSYYALDVTDPDVPKHLFSFNNDVTNKVINYWDASGKKSTFAYNASCTAFDYSKLGGAWSRPVIMLLPYSEGAYNQRWVAVFGAGYAGGASVTGTGSTSTFGAYAYAIELEPDAALSTESCGATVANAVTSTGGHVVTASALTSDGASNIPNGVTAHLSVVTGDGTSIANYYGGIAYMTDLQGKLWKWNLSKASLSDSNSGLFSLYQSFRTEATLANDRMGFNQLGTTIVTGVDSGGNTLSRLYNYFGTGDLTRIQRRAATINNRIYGVADPNFPAKLLSNTNQTVASFTNVDNQSCSVNNSWYANVWAKTGVSPVSDNQKIVGRASVYNKYVYFTAYQPEAQSCPKYGTSRLIEMSDTCQAGGAGAVIGEGLATQPTIDTKGNIYIGVSNLAPGKSLPNGVDNIAKLTATPRANSGRIQYKSWREKRAP